MLHLARVGLPDVQEYGQRRFLPLYTSQELKNFWRFVGCLSNRCTIWRTITTVIKVVKRKKGR